MDKQDVSPAKSAVESGQQDSLEGGCLCGAVRYAISQPFTLFQYCHCSRCRKVSGTAYAANIFVPSEQFCWLSGEDQIVSHKIADAKHFVTTFCQSCGSSMPSHTGDAKTAIVPAGGLDKLPSTDPEQSAPSQSIFWGSRADWYRSPEQLPQYESLPQRKPKV